MPESKSFPGIRGFQAVRRTSPGKSASEKSIDAIGNSPVKTQFLKCGKPAIDVEERPDPNPWPGAPARFLRTSPLMTRASTSFPPLIALTAKCEKPLLLPFEGRLKISQSISRPFPARPMQPVPIPPSGKDISFCRSPRYSVFFMRNLLRYFVDKKLSSSRKSYSPTCRMPCSSYQGFILVFVTTIFLKKSEVRSSGRSSLFSFSGSSMFSADWI